MAASQRSDTWFKERSIRLTASNFYDAYHCYDVKSKTFKPTPKKKGGWQAAVDYGVMYEPTAIATVQRWLDANVDCDHPKLIQNCGLYVSPSHPFLGASPDGVIPCPMTGQVLECVEVKCPYSKRFSSSDFPAYVLKNTDTGKYELDPKHQYFYQIQGQMFTTGANRCLFGVFTPETTAIMYVDRDDHFIGDMVKRLTDYYVRVMWPKVLKCHGKENIPANIVQAVEEELAGSKSQSLPVKRKLTY